MGVHHKRHLVPIAEASSLYRAGESLKLLGKRYGVSHWTVREVLVDAGVPIRNRSEAVALAWADPEAKRRRIEALAFRKRPTGVRSTKRLLAQDAVCCFCGAEDHIEQHHLNGVRSDHRPENLAPLCRDCHAKVEWFIRHATDGLRRAYRGEQPELRLAA